MSKSQRVKGCAAEREVCRIIKEKTGVDVARNLDQTRDGGGDIRYANYNIEVKRQERLNIPAWLAQAEAATPDGCEPVVAFRASRQPWRVVITLEHFLSLAKPIACLKCGGSTSTKATTYTIDGTSFTADALVCDDCGANMMDEMQMQAFRDKIHNGS
jgi:Holliday junction resolvase